MRADVHGHDGPALQTKETMETMQPRDLDRSRRGPLVVAVDVSTTACKALAFDALGNPVATARSPLGKASPHPGWQEQDPEAWWRGACEALAALTAQVPAEDIVALGITHQRETFACFDGDDRALRPGILWLDARAAEQVGRLGTPEVHHLSGKPPSTTPSLYKLAWLADHEPQVLRQAAMVADVHACLVRRLTGRWVTSWASADPLGVVDLRTFTYAPLLMDLVGLSEERFPALVPPGTIVGELSREAAEATGLPAGLPVVAGAGDGQCAGLGAAVTEDGVAYLNLGTAVTLGRHATTYHTSLAFRTLGSPLAGAWTLESVITSGALSLAWFGRQVVGGDSEETQRRLQESAAAVAPGSDGLLFLPYLTRAETPYWDGAARGAWVGLREAHGLAHMVRAILEGIAFEQRMLLRSMDVELGTATRRIRAMGGGAQSELWVRILADVLEQPIEVGPHTETTALGAAILAAASIGLDGEHDVVATAERMSRGWIAVEPERDGRASRRYRQLAPLYERLYPALSPIFRELDTDH
jgi:xylulokinase